MTGAPCIFQNPGKTAVFPVLPPMAPLRDPCAPYYRHVKFPGIDNFSHHKLIVKYVYSIVLCKILVQEIMHYKIRFLFGKVKKQVFS